MVLAVVKRADSLGFTNQLRGDSRLQTEGDGHGPAISVRTDYAIDEVRGFAKRSKDAAQARRRLAIAAVLEGATRENAASGRSNSVYLPSNQCLHMSSS